MHIFLWLCLFLSRFLVCLPAQSGTSLQPYKLLLWKNNKNKAQLIVYSWGEFKLAGHAWKRREAGWSTEEERRRASPNGEWCLRVGQSDICYWVLHENRRVRSEKAGVLYSTSHTHSRACTCNTHKVLIKMNEICSSTRTCHYIMRQLHYCSDPTVLMA